VAAPFPSGGAPAFSGALGQVHSALIGMGFKPSEAERAVTSISKSAEGKAVDALLREALGGMA
jgi:Holliday junction resolvasome RuvABC DNA-binding subunit